MRIAVVDDEPMVRKRLQLSLTKEGYEVETYGDGEALLQDLDVAFFDLVLLDVVLPGVHGMEVLRQIKDRHPDTEVIMITGYASIDSAVEAVKMGAFHYVAKPLRLEEIRNLVRRALDQRALAEENRLLKARLHTANLWDEMVGCSNAMKEVFKIIKKVAPLDCNVLIQGESGTGKELVARAIHRESPRRDGPFVAFNCGGFTEELIASELFGHERGAFTGATTTKVGILETAHTGTVFMDEIADMSPSMQGKLLRVIQEKRILRVGSNRPIQLDVRFIAASNRDLKKAVETGTFREDLYWRLNVVKIQLPRLRERKEDIPLLIQHFLSMYSRKFGKHLEGIEPAARDILLNYSYPGNVRELENIVERAVALAEGRKITVEDLPPDLRSLTVTPYGEWITLEQQEKNYIKKILEATNYNITETCRILALPRTTLWRKMKKYGLSSNV
jgi:DNA-binding NtrC family response regulator